MFTPWDGARIAPYTRKDIPTYWLTNLNMAAWAVERGFPVLDVQIRETDHLAVFYFEASQQFHEAMDAYKSGQATCRVRSFVQSFAYIRRLSKEARKAYDAAHPQTQTQTEGQVAE